MEPLVSGLGFVAMEVADLEASVEFYNTLGCLHIAERMGDTVFMTGDVAHHWLVLRQAEGEPGRFRLGFEATGEDAFDEIVRRLERRGISYQEGGDLAVDRLARSVIFVDRDGVEFEIYTQMVEMHLPPPEQTIKLSRMLHAVWGVDDAVASYELLNDVLGVLASDWRERQVVFVRGANGYHHSLGLMNWVPTGKLHHFCYLVEDVDDVVLARQQAIEAGCEIQMELVRHPPSNGIAVYIQDALNDIGVEFCAGHRQIFDWSHRPRIMPLKKLADDPWGPKGPSRRRGPKPYPLLE